MRFKIIIILIILVAGMPGVTPAASPDSLLRVIEEAATDTARLNAISDLTNHYLGSDNEQAVAYAEQGVQLAREITDSVHLQHQLNNLGIAFAHKGMFENSLEVFGEAMKINTLRADSSGMARGHNNIGLINYYMGNYEKAIKHYLQSVELREALDEQEEKAASLNNIGLIYEALDQLDKALKCHEKSLEIRQEVNSPQIGSSLANIGNIYFLQDKDTLALQYFLKAYREFEKHGQINDLALLNNNIAQIYEESGNYTKAILYYIRGLEKHKQLNDQRGIGVASSNLADLYLNTGEYDQAEKFAMQALESTEVTKALGVKKTVYKVLHRLYKDKGD